MRHLLVVVSNLTGDFLDTIKYGCHDWWLRLGAVVVWCTLLDINCDAYCATDRVKINYSRYC